jgi:membrane protein involved in colicin uptake
MPAERAQTIKSSPVYGLYDEPIDRESAYELLQVKAEKAAEAKAAEEAAAARAKEEKAAARASTSSRRSDSATDKFVKNVASSVGRQVGNMIVRNIGNSLVRGILGGLLKR